MWQTIKGPLLLVFTLASVVNIVSDPLWALCRAAGSTGLGCYGVSEKAVTSKGSQKLGVSSWEHLSLVFHLHHSSCVVRGAVQKVPLVAGKISL